MALPALYSSSTWSSFLSKQSIVCTLEDKLESRRNEIQSGWLQEYVEDKKGDEKEYTASCRLQLIKNNWKTNGAARWTVCKYCLFRSTWKRKWYDTYIHDYTYIHVHMLLGQLHMPVRIRIYSTCLLRCYPIFFHYSRCAIMRGTKLLSLWGLWCVGCQWNINVEIVTTGREIWTIFSLVPLREGKYHPNTKVY